MRWDLVVAVAVSAVVWVWWTFIRVPTALRAIAMRVPIGVTWRQLTNGTFMQHASTEERRQLTKGAPLSVSWAFGWVVYVHDVDLALDIVRKSPAVWEQIPLPAAPWSLVRQLWGTGFPVNNGPLWKLHRTIATHAFSHDALRHIHALSFLPTAKQLADAWQQRLAAAGASGGPVTVDVTEDLGAFNLRALGRAAFGFEFGDDSACQLMNTVVANILQPSRYLPGSLYDLLPVRDNAVAKDALARVNGIVHQLIRNRRDFHKRRAEQQTQQQHDVHGQADADAEYKPILMDHLLTGTDEHGRRLTDDEVRDEAFVFFIAGLDTSQLALATTVWFLAHNPTAQQRCYDEVVRVCGEHVVHDAAWGGPSYEDLKKMPFLLACLYESVRLYRLTQPVRACNAPTKVAGVTLPAGTLLIVDVWSLQRSETYWGADADRFNPLRWLDDDDDAPPGDDGGDACAAPAPRFRPNKQAFFAFGGSGPRACVGQAFTIGWQRAALSVLLTRFVLTPRPGTLKTQVLDDGKSSDLEFHTKGLFSVPLVHLHIAPRPTAAAAAGQSPYLKPAQPNGAHAHVPTQPLAAAAAAAADAKAQS